MSCAWNDDELSAGNSRRHLFAVFDLEDRVARSRHDQRRAMKVSELPRSGLFDPAWRSQREYKPRALVFRMEALTKSRTPR